MIIEHSAERERLAAYADHLEAQTQALRALNDAMALVCEQLLAPRLPEAHRPERVEQGQ